MGSEQGDAKFDGKVKKSKFSKPYDSSRIE